MAMRPLGGGRGGRRRYQPLHEINVTPLVTAPLLTVGVPVDLPKTAAAQMTDQVEPVVVSVTAEGSIFIQETEVTRDELVPRLTAITEAKRDTRVFVRGDRALVYGDVMAVMGMISAAGFDKVALLAVLPRPKSDR